MRKDNFLMAEAIKRNEQESEQDYKQSIKKWNRINTPITIRKHKSSSAKPALYSSITYS